MVLQKHELWSPVGTRKGRSAQFLEDPFELAFEKASLKILRSVCNIFCNGNTPTDELDCSCAENLRKVQRKQCILGNAHNYQFAMTSSTFASTKAHRHWVDDANNDLQRGLYVSSNQLPIQALTCTQDGDAKDDIHIDSCEPSNQFATASAPRRMYQQNKDAEDLVHRPTSQLATASSTFEPINKYQLEEETKDLKQEINHPSSYQFLRRPHALLSYIPKDVSLFFAGAVAGASAKTITAPLDRIKLLMQVHGVKATEGITKKSVGFLEAAIKIGKEEGTQGFWKGNLPQVIRVIPYSAVQLLSYELYKKLFKGNNKELSVAGRLAAGACAGMTSTLVTYPLDVLRLRVAVDPACKSMVQVASTMLREEGVSSFYRGLGPSLVGIAPYIALNFCAFDLIKKSLPEETRKTPTASFLTAFLSATLATTLCYPLDTVRRQLQMKGAPYLTVLDAFPGIMAKDGVPGLYRGFVPNALKNLPTSSIRLTTFDAAKNLISTSQREFQRLVNERRGDASLMVGPSSAKIS